MIESDKIFDIHDGEFLKRIEPVMKDFDEAVVGKRAYDFFVKELMTALDNTAKNTSAVAFNAGLFGSIQDYYRLDGKAKAFNEIYDRVAKEYGLADAYKLRAPNSAHVPMLEYVDDIVEKLFPRERTRGSRENEIMRRKVSLAIADAMYEAYNMGRLHSVWQELDDNIKENDRKC